MAALALQLPAAADDWPQWRGPERNGISKETIEVSWPAAGPGPLWRTSVGTGFSSMAIATGRVFTMGNSNNQDTVWCLAADTGKPIWKHSYPSEAGPRYYEGGPGSTPTVYQGRVYTISKWGDVFCFDSNTGKIIWAQDLRQNPGLKTNEWGFAGSPLVYKNLLILNAGASGTALDLNTGKMVWAAETAPTGYATPVLYRFQNRDLVLIFSAKHLVSVDAGSGRELWRFPWQTGYDINNADPIIHGPHVLISSYSRGAALLNIFGEAPTAIYDKRVVHSHLSPGILLGDFYYAFNGESGHPSDFRCVEFLTGELKWSKTGLGVGSVISAGNRLIVLSEKGELVLVEPSPEKCQEITRAQVLGGRCWTPPALANGSLYVRNAKGDLLCLDLRPKNRSPQKEASLDN